MNALIFIIQAISSLFVLILLVRLVLPFVHVNYRNPVVQGIFSITSPLVVPLRRVLPAIGKIDTATLVVAFAVQYITFFLIMLIQGVTPSFAMLALSSGVELIVRIIQLFGYAVIIRVILSWVAPQQYNPVTELVSAITEPLLAPARRVIPPIGGLDISPLFVMIGLFALAIFVQDIVSMLI